MVSPFTSDNPIAVLFGRERSARNALTPLGQQFRHTLGMAMKLEDTPCRRSPQSRWRMLTIDTTPARASDRSSAGIRLMIPATVSPESRI